MADEKCPLQGTRHYPCGMLHDDPGECQFRDVCRQMQEDAERFAERNSPSELDIDPLTHPSYSTKEGK